MIRLRRPVLAIAGGALVAVLLGGCGTWFLPPRPQETSTPTEEDVPAELRPFYSQVLDWEACGNGMQCAMARAPMNWEEPTTGEIELALIRKPARGAKIGSLLVNPGGPGASGYDFILESSDFATSARLQERFDIVGFDPRGVGRSSAVTCYDDPAVMDHFNYDILPGEPGSDDWFAEAKAASDAFAEGCLEHTGELLQYVDTVSAARDMDLLRAVLGDEKLNYLGSSYGTFLGATYANLYPERTGRFVLDGAVDPATSLFDVTRTQAVGFESAFRAYLAACPGRDTCPFTGSVEDAVAETAAILDSLAASPIPNADGRLLGASTMFVAIILPLYNEANWGALDGVFTQVKQGVADYAFQVADVYTDREIGGGYKTNSTEARLAINCLDFGDTRSIETLRDEAQELAEVAPLFGPQMSYGSSCGSWPFPATRERGPITAPGSPDILVVGTTNDPATPYVWAQNLAEQLEKGHLVTYNGEGHTAYNKSNDCVNDTIDDFFIDGTVPASDPNC